MTVGSVPRLCIGTSSQYWPGFEEQHFRKDWNWNPTLPIARESCAYHPNHKERRAYDKFVTGKVIITHAPTHLDLPAWLLFNPATSQSKNWSTRLTSCLSLDRPQILVPFYPDCQGIWGVSLRTPPGFPLKCHNPKEPICTLRDERRWRKVTKDHWLSEQ